jgi:hypothetical protein
MFGRVSAASEPAKVSTLSARGRYNLTCSERNAPASPWFKEGLVVNLTFKEVANWLALPAL